MENDTQNTSCKSNDKSCCKKACCGGKIVVTVLLLGIAAAIGFCAGTHHADYPLKHTAPSAATVPAK